MSGVARTSPAAAGPVSGDALSASRACDRCLRRSWLIGRLAGHLDHARGRIDSVLALCNEDLIAAFGGAIGPALLRECEAVNLSEVRARSRVGGLELLCRCDPS